MHAGHYYCYVRTASGVWHRLDDQQVSQVSVQKVLSESAYMLFYQREGKAPPVPALAPSGGVGPSKGTWSGEKLNGFGGPSAPTPELPSSTEDEEEEEEEESEEEFEEPPPRARRAAFLASAQAIDDANAAQPAFLPYAAPPPRRAAAKRAETLIANEVAQAAAPTAERPPRRAAAKRAQTLTANEVAQAVAPAAAAPGIRKTRAAPVKAPSHRRSLLSSLAPYAGKWAWWRGGLRRRRSSGSSPRSGGSPRSASGDNTPDKAPRTGATPQSATAAPSKSNGARVEKPAASAPLATAPASARPVSQAPIPNGVARATKHAPQPRGPSSKTFGAAVGTWEDVALPSPPAPAANGKSAKRQPGEKGGAPAPKRQRGYDFWDAQIDKGHVRKTKGNREERMQERRATAAKYLAKAGAKAGRGQRRTTRDARS